LLDNSTCGGRYGGRQLRAKVEVAGSTSIRVAGVELERNEAAYDPSEGVHRFSPPKDEEVLCGVSAFG
jgi:hypothetical protein